MISITRRKRKQTHQKDSKQQLKQRILLGVVAVRSGVQFIYSMQLHLHVWNRGDRLVFEIRHDDANHSLPMTRHDAYPRYGPRSARSLYSPRSSAESGSVAPSRQCTTLRPGSGTPACSSPSSRTPSDSAL